MTTPHPQWDEVERRFDMVRYQLSKQYKWARRTIRSLDLRETQNPMHTVGVDKYLRLRANAEYVLPLSKAELAGVLWHEVNHILRHHPDRLSDEDNHMLANIAADFEINGDLREQQVTLPDGLLYPEMASMDPFHAAEEYYTGLVAQQVEATQPGPGDSDSDGTQEGDADGGDSQQGADGGDSGSDGASDGSSGGSPGGQSQGPGQQAGGKQPSGGKGQDKPGQRPTLPNPNCGSGAGNDPGDEDDPPDDEDQARLDREARRQAEDILDEVEKHGYSQTGRAMHRAAVEFLGRSTVDWRRQIGVWVRTTMELRMDEAEEFTFRRPSRRQAGLPEGIILPASTRPIPRLGVVCDVSGSMDEGKLRASLREVHGVLERLAIPEFTAYGWSTGLESTVQVRGPRDIEGIFHNTGGGTNMLSGIAHAIKDGHEVILCATDMECSWLPWEFEVPVVILGINAENTRYRDQLPAHVPVVDVTSDERL